MTKLIDRTGVSTVAGISDEVIDRLQYREGGDTDIICYSNEFSPRQYILLYHILIA